MQSAVNYGNEPVPQPKDARQFHGEGLQAGEQPKVAGKTIGDALEDAAAIGADKPLTLKDVRTIQSAEARATGSPAGVLGGPAQYADNLLRTGQRHTLGEVLQDAKDYLPADKVVTQLDADRIQQAEQRNDPRGMVDPAGVGAAVREAAEQNIARGVVPPAGGAAGIAARTGSAQ